MLRGLCEDKVIEVIGMPLLLSREYLRKALSLSEKFYKTETQCTHRETWYPDRLTSGAIVL